MTTNELCSELDTCRLYIQSGGKGTWQIDIQLRLRFVCNSIDANTIGTQEWTNIQLANTSIAFTVRGGREKDTLVPLWRRCQSISSKFVIVISSSTGSTSNQTQTKLNKRKLTYRKWPKPHIELHQILAYCTRSILYRI